MSSKPNSLSVITFIYILILVLSLYNEFATILEDFDINLNPFDYARITDLDYTAYLLDDAENRSKMLIKERITFDIHAASKNNLFWELWRDLPEDTVDGLKIRYKVKSVKQILPDGKTITYEESPKLYWEDYDYVPSNYKYGPGKWFHSDGYDTPGDENYECLMLYIDGTYRDKLTFEIEYEMTNPALSYADCSELYLCLYSGNTIKHLKSLTGKIIISEEDMPSQGNYYAHTYGTNSNKFPFYETDSLYPGYHTFVFDLDESDLKFKPYNQYIEFCLLAFGSDKNKFTDYAPNNLYYTDNYLNEALEEHQYYEDLYKDYKKLKFKALLFCIIISLIMIEIAKTKKIKIYKKYNFNKPEIDYDYFREIPSNLDPFFATTLTFIKNGDKNKSDGFSAILLSLVRKKYITLEKLYSLTDWIPSNVNIVIKYIPSSSIEIVENFIGEYDGYESLTQNEQLFFNLIIKYAENNSITLSSLQHYIKIDYDNTSSFMNSLDTNTSTIGISQGYLQKLQYEEPKHELLYLSNKFKNWGIFILLINIITYFTRFDLLYGGLIILGLTLLGVSYYLYNAGNKAILLTQFGENEYAKWHGLYKFLNSATLMHERTIIELPLWEQYLVYATAFGISKKVIKAINIRCPEFAESTSALNNSYYYSKRFHTTCRSFRSSMRSAYHSSYSSSHGGYSRSGGHHYGGGGRGGGGGGGGH